MYASLFGYASHHYNLIYSLNPVKAYDMGLVKQIEVDSVLEENSQNGAFVELTAITTTKTKITAKVTIDVNDREGVKRKSVTVKVGDDLYDLSNNREIYREGYIVEGIDASNGFVSFSNNEILYQGQQQGGLCDEIMKFQIRRTIAVLFEKSRSTITEHLQNIFHSQELQENSVCRKFRRTAADGKGVCGK